MIYALLFGVFAYLLFWRVACVWEWEKENGWD